MNFAFLLRSKVATTLHLWALRFLASESAAPALMATSVTQPSNRTANTGQVPNTASLPCIQTRRPLRVVRVMESGQPRAHVGRMVISGRMADVCAELDRLAAREAAENCCPSSRSVAMSC
jgi:hypothetical protein